MPKINALCLSDPHRALEDCDRLIYCGDAPVNDDRVTRIYRPGGQCPGDVYLADMRDEEMLEWTCDYVMNYGRRAYIRAAFDLNEAGELEAKYKLSPIMLLHRLGMLGYCTVVGGVCLDNDDLDLMAQEDVPLIVTPTASAGYGHGFAPVCAALSRGLKVGIGTLDGKYSHDALLSRELDFLKLTANAEMRCENALTAAQLKAIAAFEKIIES